MCNNDIPWRVNSFENDGQGQGHDLSGGYFDAGDYVKFNFPMAAATTVLAWGMVDFADGYKFADKYEDGLATLKWATDYFIKCHTGKNKSKIYLIYFDAKIPAKKFFLARML